MFKSKVFVAAIFAILCSNFVYSETTQNDQYSTLLDNQNQIVSNIIQSQAQVLEKVEWERKLRYIKIAAVCVGVTAALIGGSLFTYYIFNKMSHALQDPTKEEIKALDELQKTSENMTNNLTDIDTKIKKVSENNQLIKSNLNLGITKIEANKKTLSSLRIKVDQRLADLKLVGFALEKLNHTEQEIEQLKQNEVINRKLHKYYVQEAFKLINESKKQKKTVNELVEIIVELKKDIEALRNRQKLLEDKEYLRHDTQSALINMTFENKKKLVEILNNQKSADNIESLKKYIAGIAYKISAKPSEPESKSINHEYHRSSMSGLNLASAKK